MMKHGTLALLLVAVTGAPVAGAQTVSGFGAKTCRDYLSAVDKGQTPAIDGYVSWAQGFISAHNWLNDTGRDVEVDHGGLTFWLVGECTRRPGARFYEAMQRFIAEHAR